MSKTPRRLRHAKAEYAALHYLGDLTADVRGRSAERPHRFRRIGWAIAASAAIVSGILFMTTFRTPPTLPTAPLSQTTAIWSMPTTGTIPSLENLPACPGVEWCLPQDIPYPAMSVPWPSDLDSQTPLEKTS